MASRRYHLNDVAMREARAQERGIGHGQPGGAWLLIWHRLVMGAIRDSVAATNALRAEAAASGVANHSPHDAVLAPGEGFYVSLIRGSRTALLAGPFDTHPEAKEQERRAFNEACAVDPWAAFDAYGTCKAPTRRLGVEDARLGL